MTLGKFKKNKQASKMSSTANDVSSVEKKEMSVGYQNYLRSIKVEKIKPPVLVVSKDFFNESGEIIGCPIIGDSNEGPLHIWTSTKEVEGYVQCEKIALLDLSVRGYEIIDSMPLSELINISDAIQGIFEYI